MQEVKVGTYTGAAGSTSSLFGQSVIIGFAPDRVDIQSDSEIWRWQTPLSSGHAWLIEDTGSILLKTAQGVNILTDAMFPTGGGFRVGSSINKVNTVYYYTAVRNG